MKNVKNDFVLSLFKNSEDQRRPALNKINLENGKLHATDAHAIAIINAELCVNQYKTEKGFPECQSLFDEHIESERIVLKIDSLISSFAKCSLDWHFEKENCDQCEGSGEKICACCDNSTECENCDGEGGVESKKPFPEFKLSGDNIEIFNRNYLPRLFHKILYSALILGVDEIELINGESGINATLVNVSYFSFLIMPKLKET